MQIRMPLRLRNLKDSGKKRLFVIPYIFTFANACLGFLAVLYAWDDCCRNASYCIMLAALADALDGRLARALGSCSSLAWSLIHCAMQSHFVLLRPLCLCCLFRQ